MRKLILAVTALLGFSVFAHAQLGVMAGVTSSESNFKSAWAEAENITQYHLGLAMRFPVASVFSIQPAVIYNIKGQQIGAVLDGSDFHADFKTGFVEVPVQLQLGFDINGFRPYVFTEPFVGYAVTNQSKERFGETVQDVTASEPVEAKTDWNNVKSRIEYGVGLGVGIDLLNHMQISVRYFWNKGPLYNNDAIGTKIQDVDTKVEQDKCSGIMVSAALFF